MVSSNMTNRLGSGNECNRNALVHDLPPEVLSRVFEFSRDLGSDSDGFALPARSTSPLLLTWICSYWRHTAVSTHSLWTSVSLGTNGSSPASDERVLEVFLSRSGDVLPLSFSLTYNLPESSRPGEFLIEKPQSKAYLCGIRVIANRLLSVRHRWRHLIVNTLVLGALEPFLGALSLGTPMLETLSVSNNYSGFHGRGFKLDLTSCPRLRTARILSPRILFDPSLPLLQHLTTLDLHFVSSQLDVIDWLSSSPNVEKVTLELYAATQQLEASSTTRQILLQRLRHFSLTCFYGESDPGLLLDVLVLPSLHSFSFSRCRLALLGPDRSWRNVISLLERSGNPPLDELRLIDTPEDAAKLIQVLRRTRSIRNLILGGDAVTDDVLLKMHEKPNMDWDGTGDDPLCPALECLELLHVPASFHSVVALESSRAEVTEEDTRANRFRTLKKLSILNEEFSRYFTI